MLAFGATVLTAFGAGFVLTACATPENETPNTQPVINQPVDPNLPDEKENEITNPGENENQGGENQNQNGENENHGNQGEQQEQNQEVNVESAAELIAAQR